MAWVRYPLGRALFECLRVSPAAELAHRRMADYYWQTGQWPSTRNYDAAALARVSPKRWLALITELQALGWREHRGRVMNSGVHRVRADAVASLNQTRIAGSRGAKRRWKGTDAPEKPSTPDGPPIGPPYRGPNGPPNGY